ncbi:MAG: hypothetical protein M3R68_01115 [Acidobacteriota bacterium]|nr:hypothetical protein [Acidobacteriota bacterium]
MNFGTPQMAAQAPMPIEKVVIATNRFRLLNMDMLHSPFKVAEHLSVSGSQSDDVLQSSSEQCACPTIDLENAKEKAGIREKQETLTAGCKKTPHPPVRSSHTHGCVMEHITDRITDPLLRDLSHKTLENKTYLSLLAG